MLEKQKKRKKRHKKIRTKIHGTALRPRLSVFRSNQHIYAQVIDDENGKTLVSVNDLEIKKDKKIIKKEEKMSKNIFLAYEVGKMIAEKMKKLPDGKKVEKIIFDRGGYKYHGKIKALAEGAREGGLNF